MLTLLAVFWSSCLQELFHNYFILKCWVYWRQSGTWTCIKRYEYPYVKITFWTHTQYFPFSPFLKAFDLEYRHKSKHFHLKYKKSHSLFDVSLNVTNPNLSAKRKNTVQRKELPESFKHTLGVTVQTLQVKSISSAPSFVVCYILPS